MFVDSPTEQSTAITDLILALQSLIGVIMLKRIPVKLPMWTDIWTWFFGLLCLASFLGAVVHGFQVTPLSQSAIWGAIYFALGLMMALFVTAALTLTWNPQLSRRCIPYLLVISAVFFASTQFWNNSFLLFIAYEAICMAVALTLYTVCIWPRRRQGARFLAAGVMVGIAAAMFDTQKSMELKLIWTFDHHGIFHLVQMLSLLLLILGVQASHRLSREYISEQLKVTA